MQFFASICPGSVIDRRWRLLGHRSGSVSGVTFHTPAGSDVFVSKDEIPDHALAFLQANPSVEVSMATRPVGAAEPVADDDDGGTDEPGDGVTPRVTPTVRKRISS